jgi:hypothetical protein
VICLDCSDAIICPELPDNCWCWSDSDSSSSPGGMLYPFQRQ